MPPRPAFTLLALFALAPDGPPKLAVPEPFAGRIGQTVSLAQRIGDDAKFGIDLPLRVDGRRIQIPADALPGAYRLRLAGPNGVSAFRVFAADDRPIVAPSDAILTLPCTVAGIVESESTHTARVRLKAGRRLAVEAVARRLGSPLDPHLRIRDAKTGRELPGLAVDDTPGLQGDCRLTVTPDHDAELLIDLRDSTSRGGGEYRYLLRFGDFPSATCSLPLAVPRGQRSPVTFIGRDATGVDSQSVDAPADRDLMALRIAPRRGKESGWSLPLLLSDHPEIVEVEPNDTVAQATPLPMPGGASGILGRVGDRDFYRFPAKKGQSLLVRSSQAELALATDVALSILDESGKTLAASDGKDASATVRFTPPANGNYYLRVEHLQYGGGPGDAYRVTVTPSVETFRFAVAVDAVKLPAGGTAKLPVATLDRLGYDGEVQFELVGVPGVTAAGSLAAGKATPPPPKPKNACDDPPPYKGGPIIVVTLTAEADAKPGFYRGRLRGRSADRKVAVLGTVRTPLLAGLSGLTAPPPEWETEIAVVIAP